MELSEDLSAFQIELAGRLAMADDPGPEIRSLRDKYAFTQEWLARLLRIRRESLSRIESGRVHPGTAFLQRFTRIMTLAHGAREHLAAAERAGGRPDPDHLRMLSQATRLDRDSGEEIVLASMRSYEKKRRGILRELEAET